MANKDTGTSASIDDGMMLLLSIFFFLESKFYNLYVKIVCCLFEFIVLWKSVLLF